MERFMEPCLLLVLSKESLHGYELLDRLAVFGFCGGGADATNLYRTLRRLEKEGALVSNWQTSGSGPARRYYEITDSGRQMLPTWAETLSGNRQRIEKFLTEFNKEEE